MILSDFNIDKSIPRFRVEKGIPESIIETVLLKRPETAKISRNNCPEIPAVIILGNAL